MANTMLAKKPYPLLALRDIVIFPHMIVPLFVGRKKSIRCISEERKNKAGLILATQKDVNDNNPSPDDIYDIGVFGKIMQCLELPDGTVKILVEGLSRVTIVSYTDNKDFFEVHAQPLAQECPPAQDNDMTAMVRTVTTLFQEYAQTSGKISSEMLTSLSKIEDPAQRADTIAAHIPLRIQEKQALLAQTSVPQRLESLSEKIHHEINLLKVEQRIQKRVKKQMDKSQRDYYLNEQMKAIQQELNDSEDGGGDIKDLHQKIEKTKLSAEAREKALNDLKKLRSMSMMSAEANVIRNYLDWLLDIPWKKYSSQNKDLQHAKTILDEDHYGLHKVKERILEHLAVQQRTKRVSGPILCLVGPPGVGKTSLGQSIARATGREFIRVSLGGVHDESEIRGHRRTYIGSMPGRIIQGMKKSKTSNPLFLLDEIDKLGVDWRGDPSSALLEVLDPEQNTHFNDHYLEVDYDLSKVMFITTSNRLTMQKPLLDRLEIIRIEGYTEEEKKEIARRHLIPKLQKRHGLKENEWTISQDAMSHMIQAYTREAGVRNLERELAKLMRKTIYRLATKQETPEMFDKEHLQDYLGVPYYQRNEPDPHNLVGIVSGLAWTESGGDILTIESVSMPGKGKALYTGKLSDVMQESVQAAMSFVRSRAPALGIAPECFEKYDIHVHFPEGAIPKDGPSAGIGIVLSIVSTLTDIPVNRHVAMTGEITLSGRILTIGGLKEKMLAAARHHMKKILIPHDNVKDLADIPEAVKETIDIVPIHHADDIFSHALMKPLKPLASENLSTHSSLPTLPKEETKGVVTH
ncbi:MAG: endopeptidase La [Alphaproteobacteria bacterium GM7ARS4]|nr:endopeptidase La [Alphaproteobacteria bacterium GM7ARS4]